MRILFPDRLTDQDRRAVLDRLAELQSVDRLMREPGRQKPPDPPVPLAMLTMRSAT